MAPLFPFKALILFYLKYCIVNCFIYLTCSVIYIMVTDNTLNIPILEILKSFFVTNSSIYLVVWMMMSIFFLPFFLVLYLLFNHIDVFFNKNKIMYKRIVLFLIGTISLSLFLFFLVLRGGWGIQSYSEIFTTFLYLVLNNISLYLLSPVRRSVP